MIEKLQKTTRTFRAPGHILPLSVEYQSLGKEMEGPIVHHTQFVSKLYKGVALDPAGSPLYMWEAAATTRGVPSIATKIVPGRVCPRTRQQLHARACGFFHVRRWKARCGEEPCRGQVEVERASLSLSFPVLEFDPGYLHVEPGQ